jgi:hypothetical protein
MKVAYFLNLYCHKKFQKPTFSDTSVIPISGVCLAYVATGWQKIKMHAVGVACTNFKFLIAQYLLGRHAHRHSDSLH